MDRLPAELLYILAIAGFLLFNFVMQKLAQRRQQEEAAQAPPEPPPAEQPLEEQPLDDIWGRTPTRPTPAAVAPVLAARPAPIPRPAERSLPRRLHPVRALLNNPRDLRRAVVLMMVLGPCRAQEPPER